MDLIAVVMGAENSDNRFSAARKLLDYGFANYQHYTVKNDRSLAPVKVEKGIKSSVEVKADTDFSTVIPKGQEDKIEEKMEIASSLKAPVEKGQTVGKITVTLEGEKLCEIPIKAVGYVGKRGFFSSLRMLIQLAFSGKL